MPGSQSCHLPSIEPDTVPEECLLRPAEEADEPAFPASDGAMNPEAEVVPFIPAVAAALPPAPEEPGAAPPAAKRVLLLEDDPTFREVITAFFAENGYAVREAKSGIEGIQEVLAGDFAVVLCDMMMPGLPGDLFYRAVERARPQLCERFIFMSGHRGDSISNDFIKAVNGRLLLKPFSLDSLLLAVSVMESRHSRSAVAPPLDAATVRARQEPVAAPPVRVLPEPDFSPPVRVLPDPIPARVAADPPTAPLPAKPQRAYAAAKSTTDDETRNRLRMRTAVAMLLAMIALPAGWYFRADHLNKSAWNELRTLENRWEVLEVELAEARRVGERFEEFADRAAQVTEDCKGHYWSSALQRIVASTPPQIQIREMRMRRDASGVAAWSLRIGALCTGTRMDADGFRHKVEQDLAKVFPGAVKIGFEAIEDIPAATGETAGGATVEFTLVATIGSAGEPTTLLH